VAERGVWKTFTRSASRGIGFLRDRVTAVRVASATPQSDFDREYGVDTDGAHDNETLLRNLDIESPNWIHGSSYIPVDPSRFQRAIAALPVAQHGYTFVDFGCGKGRAVLLASAFAFERLVGIDFSRELIAAAQANWARFDRDALACRTVEWRCEDFLTSELPSAPVVLYFYHPCDERLLRQVAARIQASLTQNPRPAFVMYLNPLHADAWTDIGFRRVEANALGSDALFANAAALATLARNG
jgi:SAM-dependent methyltransferase